MIDPASGPRYASGVLIRPRFHWAVFALGLFYVLLAIVKSSSGRDPFYIDFMAPFGALLIVAWATTYTTLSNGVLMNRKLFFWSKCFAVSEIESVEPHQQNGKWSYGAVFNVWTKSGEKLTLQPNHPEPFLAMLKQQAPGADFRL